MEERLPCDTHSEQIRNLIEKDINTNKKLDEKDIATNKRIDGMADLREIMHSLDKNMNKQTQMLEHIVEHNNKQDIRMDKQEERMDKQQEVIVKVNENLTDLARGQVELSKGQKALEEQVNDNEDKHSIDIRDIDKKKYMDILFRYVLPAGGALVIILEILKVWKG